MCFKEFLLNIIRGENKYILNISNYYLTQSSAVHFKRFGVRKATIMRRPLLILFLQRKRLVKLLIIAIAFFALYQIVSITRTVQMPMVLKFPSHRAEIPLEKASLNVLKDQEVITSGLNAHIWYDVCPSSIQAFCNYPLFPKAANEKTVIRTPDLTRNQDTYVQRIFG